MDEEIDIELETEDIDVTASITPDFLKGNKGDKGDKGDKRR